MQKEQKALRRTIYFKMRWLNKDSETFLKRDYLLEGVEVEQRIDQICKRAAEILNKPDLEAKFKEIITKGWCSLSTPIWTNFGLDRGLPISCFGSYIEDDMAGILYTASEVGMMSKYGGGTSAYFGELRERGASIKNNGQSSGSAHFAGLFDSMVNIVSQGKTRRGSFAGYQDIFHPDIDEWLDFKTEGNNIQDIFHAVCVPDWWMQKMIDGDRKFRKTWAKVIQRRTESGLPYIFFTDNVNKNKPQVYKDKKLKIYNSNLCTEICEPTGIDESFVCCILSMNLLYWDEWSGTDAAYYMTWFLDAVMSEFIDKAKGLPFMKRAVNFAVRQRALGLGVLGWHSYLQSKMIPFESLSAKHHNVLIHQRLNDETYKASQDLAKEYGEPELLKGYGLRNATRLAIAPTTSSAFILGQVSPSIEPLSSNYFIKDLAKGKFSYRNPYLEKLLEDKGQNTEDVWISILKKDGSVQHLDCLNQTEKDVFKTFDEISQIEIIIQAAQRQKYIDQSQSLNLKIHPDTPVKEINALYIKAWELGIKTLYYQRSTNLAQEMGRSLLECKSCEA